MPFPLALDDQELEGRILEFEEAVYLDGLETLFRETGMVEDGNAAGRVADVICRNC